MEYPTLFEDLYKRLYKNIYDIWYCHGDLLKKNFFCFNLLLNFIKQVIQEEIQKCDSIIFCVSIKINISS